MALFCGPASTMSYANRVQPVPLSAPTARASPSHGDQSQTHPFPGEQYKGLGMPRTTTVSKLASSTPRQDVSSCPLANSLSYYFFFPTMSHHRCQGIIKNPLKHHQAHCLSPRQVACFRCPQS